jgi:hypothetical protein
LCGLQDHGAGEVEDAMDALDRQPDGSRVEEIHLEQPEPRVRTIQRLQVLRLSLVLCKSNQLKRLEIDPVREDDLERGSCYGCS